MVAVDRVVGGSIGNICVTLYEWGSTQGAGPRRRTFSSRDPGKSRIHSHRLGRKISLLAVEERQLATRRRSTRPNLRPIQYENYPLPSEKGVKKKTKTGHPIYKDLPQPLHQFSTLPNVKGQDMESDPRFLGSGDFVTGVLQEAEARLKWQFRSREKSRIIDQVIK